MVVLKLCDPASDYNQANLAAHRPQLPPSDVFANVFFDPGAEAQKNRMHLTNMAVFIRFTGRLKSMRIPSMVIDTSSREIRIDWRQLCQDFLLDELKTNLSSLGR